MSIRQIVKKWLKKDYYVLADPEDGSLTLSEDLYNRMQKDTGDKLNNVYLFSYSQKYGRERYGWICNPEDLDPFKGKDVPMATVQYNGKYKSIGFMPTNPTLAMIYYEYGLPWDKKVKMSISREKTATGTIYYGIEVL